MGGLVIGVKKASESQRKAKSKRNNLYIICSIERYLII